VATLVPRDRGLLLENDDATTAVGLEQLVRRSETNDAAADDDGGG